MRLGKVTENVLKRSVWKKIHKADKKSAAGYTDCASFEISGEKRKTSGVVHCIAPVTCNITHAGKYAVISAVNNIFAAGGVPEQVDISVLLPPDADEQRLRTIMEDADKTALALGIEISGGHTEVTGAVNYPLITASATGTADRREIRGCSGTSLVMTKWTGLSGTAMIAEERREEISSRYPSFIAETGLEFGTVKYLSIADEARIAADNGALCMHDVSNGGIFAALWEIGQMTGCGMDVYLKSIPIRQETVEITDMFDVSPYQMHSQGSLLIVSDDADRLLAELEKAGIPASVIGTLNDTNDRIIHNDDENRFLDLPQADEILKVF